MSSSSSTDVVHSLSPPPPLSSSPPPPPSTSPPPPGWIPTSSPKLSSIYIFCSPPTTGFCNTAGAYCLIFYSRNSVENNTSKTTNAQQHCYCIARTLLLYRAHNAPTRRCSVLTTEAHLVPVEVAATAAVLEEEGRGRRIESGRVDGGVVMAEDALERQRHQQQQDEQQQQQDEQQQQQQQQDEQQQQQQQQQQHQAQQGPGFPETISSDFLSNKRHSCSIPTFTQRWG
jgi:hypothetical protein